jgi:hypothetical protein
MNVWSDRCPCEQLICLVYELLDAHDDTARMAASLAADPVWQPHLAYLRDLQRLGREMVAAAAGELEAGSLGSR